MTAAHLKKARMPGIVGSHVISLAWLNADVSRQGGDLRIGTDSHRTALIMPAASLASKCQQPLADVRLPSMARWESYRTS